VIEVSAVAPSNASFPIETKFEGSSIELNLGRFPKVKNSIAVIGLSGAKVTVSRLGLSANAPLRIVVTELGIVIDARNKDLKKAESSMVVTEDGTMYEVAVLPDGYAINVVKSLLNKTPS
jgi:hypothetical protein